MMRVRMEFRMGPLVHVAEYGGDGALLRERYTTTEAACRACTSIDPYCRECRGGGE